jgi:NAD(P)-dependent dehydrogenase (short-subunit alcohol dehydrogenase family)
MMGGKILRLENKVAVITGSSLGIGSVIALAFAKEGAAVAVDYRSHPDEAKEIVEQVEGSGGRAISVHAGVLYTSNKHSDPHGRCRKMSRMRQFNLSSIGA